MYRVGICSCNRAIQSTLVESLLKISIELDFEFKLKLFSTPVELIGYYRNENPNLHIILVDTDAKDLSYSRLIVNIRNVYDGEFKPIILVNDIEYVINNLEMQPFEYLFKPIAYAQIKKKIVNICRNIRRSESEYICVNSSGENILLKHRDIIMIESAKDLSSKGKLEIETKAGRLIAKGKLSDYAEKLRRYQFLQIHRSYVVNLDYVNSLRGNSIVLKDHREFPIGRSKMKDIRAIYNRFAL